MSEYKTYEVRVYSDGSKSWLFQGKLHREDGPACEWASGAKSWYLNGKLHREDGPAVEWTDGTKEWWLNGKLLTEAEHKAAMSTCEDKVVLIDGVEYKLVRV